MERIPAPLLRGLAIAVAAGATVSFGTVLVLGSQLGWDVGWEGSPLRAELPWLTAMFFAVPLGAFLAFKLPRHPVPWLLMALGVGFIGFPTIFVLVAYATADGIAPNWVPYLAWTGNWIWMVGHLGGSFLLLLFPDGHPLNRRWRTVARVGAGYGLVLLTFLMVWPRLEGHPEIVNPFGLEALDRVEQLQVLVVGVVVLMLLAVTSLMLRYVRSRGVERQQMKWVTFAAASLGAVIIAGQILSLPRWIQSVPTLFLLVAIVVAVLRYRLYEIDRIINRAAVYTSVTATLVGLYAASVVLLQGVLRPISGSSDLAVAASTLAVAAAFGPVRVRVQRFVDRRFSRERYDAQRSVESFSRRVRDEVDLDRLAVELREAVATTLRPGAVSLWFAEPEART